MGSNGVFEVRGATGGVYEHSVSPAPANAALEESHAAAGPASMQRRCKTGTDVQPTHDRMHNAAKDPLRRGDAAAIQASLCRESEQRDERSRLIRWELTAGIWRLGGLKYLITPMRNLRQITMVAGKPGLPRRDAGVNALPGRAAAPAMPDGRAVPQHKPED